MPLYVAEYGFRLKGAFYRAGTKLDAPAEVLEQAGVLDLVKPLPEPIEPPKEHLAEKPKQDEPVKIEADAAPDQPQTEEEPVEEKQEQAAKTKEAIPAKNRAIKKGDAKTKSSKKGGK